MPVYNDVQTYRSYLLLGSAQRRQVSMSGRRWLGNVWTQTSHSRSTLYASPIHTLDSGYNHSMFRRLAPPGGVPARIKLSRKHSRAKNIHTLAKMVVVVMAFEEPPAYQPWRQRFHCVTMENDINKAWYYRGHIASWWILLPPKFTVSCSQSQSLGRTRCYGP